MFKTRVTEMLGIQYPIIQGGMIWLARAELVAAVSNAGGLGILSSLTFSTPEEWREEIIKTRSLTDKPFGVNLPFLPGLRPVKIEDFIDAAIEEGVKIAETVGRSPEPYMEKRGASLEELAPVISGLKEKEIFETGEIDIGILHCGEVVGLIRDIPSVKEVIDRIITGAQEIRQRLGAEGLFQPLRNA